jgi:hypothetical protein
MTYCNKNTILNFLIIFGVIIFWCIRLTFSSGMLTPDSIQYFNQANSFWEYKVNFPLGYPLAIKVLSFITGSFFTASKLLNLLSYLGIIIFSYRKKFYFSQTLIVFSFYPFINFYSYSISEPLYFFINYIIIYTIYGIIQNGFRVKTSVVLFFLFFLLVSVRFSGLFIFAISIIFMAYIAYKKKYSVLSFLNTATLSALGVIIYLVINYLYCGYLFGKRDHLQVEYVEFFNIFIPKMISSVGNNFSIFNAILHKGILSRISFLNIYVGLGMIFFSFLYAVIKRKEISEFSIYLLFGFSDILISLFYSYYTTYIDASIRIQSNAYLYLILFIVINLPKNTINYLKIFIISILIFNSITLFIYSENIKTYISRYEKLIDSSSRDKKIFIIYKNINDNNERNDSRLLLFKAILIDRNYQIIESNATDHYDSKYYIRTSDITGKP